MRIAQIEMAAGATQVCRVVETNAIELRRLSLASRGPVAEGSSSFMLRPVVRSCLDTGSFFQATSGTNNRDSWPLVEDDALQCFVAVTAWCGQRQRLNRCSRFEPFSTQLKQMDGRA